MLSAEEAESIRRILNMEFHACFAKHAKRTVKNIATAISAHVSDDPDERKKFVSRCVPSIGR